MRRRMDLITAALILALRRLPAATDLAIRRLHLTRVGALFAVVALVIVGVAMVALGAVSEDVVSSNGLEKTDLTELQIVQDHRAAALIAIAKTVSLVGSVPVLAMLGVVAVGLLWLRGERLFVAVSPVVALAAGGVVVGVAKALVGRARPPLPLRLIAESGGSFPSGHSGDSAAFFITLAVVGCATVIASWTFRAVAVVAAAGLVGLVGLGRIILGVHYPTDVLAGWLTGMIVAVVVSTGTLYLRHLVGIDDSNTIGNRFPQMQRVVMFRRPSSGRSAMVSVSNC